MSYEAALQAKGYTLQQIPMDNGKFLQAVQTGNLVFTAGQVSSWGDRQIKGKVGADVSVEEAYEGAVLAAVNCLQAVKLVTGSLDNIERIVKVFGMVNVAPDFDNTPGVINGCSELLREIFGEVGYHARSAIGLTVPFNWAVEIEMVVQVK